MQVKYLVYRGNKETGSLHVRSEKLNSPWRIFTYHKNKKTRIGREIPESIAKHIVRGYKDLFEIEKNDLDIKESFKLLLTDLYEDFHIDISKEDAQEVATEVFNLDIQKQEEVIEKKSLRRKKRE